MASLVDVQPDNVSDDLDVLEKQLTAAVNKTVEKTDDKKSDEHGDPLAGTKFEGKTVDDILSSYRNLESAYGRMANDLGDQRKLTDRLLDLKREDDLQRNAPDPIKVDGAQLLDNPTDELNRFMVERESRLTSVLDNRLAELERKLEQDRFAQKHPDYATVGGDPEFLTWAQADPTRNLLGVRASQGDWEAADILLSQYKANKNVSASTKDEGQGVEDARKVSLESAASSGEPKSGQTYSRAALMRMRIERPTEYSDPSFQEEILRAYSEGRVK